MVFGWTKAEHRHYCLSHPWQRRRLLWQQMSNPAVMGALKAWPESVVYQLTVVLVKLKNLHFHVSKSSYHLYCIDLLWRNDTGPASKPSDPLCLCSIATITLRMPPSVPSSLDQLKLQSCSPSIACPRAPRHRIHHRILRILARIPTATD